MSDQEALKQFTILRTHPDNEYATFGTIDCEGIPFAQTLEKKWRNNEPFKSCIPAGEYIAELRFSPKYKSDLFEILDVQGRERVLIHWGNLDEDTDGCILIGESFGRVPSRKKVGVVEPGVISSRSAPGMGFREFESMTAGLKRIRVIIADCRKIMPERKLA